MKQHRRGSKGPRCVDPTFLEALEDWSSSGLSSGRQAVRKTKQFCSQVQQALNLALADGSVGKGLNDLFVEEVRPAPDCGRLLVRVLVPDELSVAEAMAALSTESPRLRAEVASAITRKRAPQLHFVSLNAEEADDE